MSESTDAGHGALPDDRESLHPALVGAVYRRGGVGGRETVATLTKLVAAGVVEVEPILIRQGASERYSVELRLAPGPAHAAHSGHGGPVVKQGHVDGLDRIDRALLSLIFDRVAHSATTTLALLQDFSRDERVSFWSGVQEWRDLVRLSAKEQHLLGGPVPPSVLMDTHRLRHEVRAQIVALGAEHPGRQSRPSVRLVELSLVFGFDRALSKVLRESADLDPTAPAIGLEALRWLCVAHAHEHAPTADFRRCFSPSPAEAFPPLQFGATMPSYLKCRVVDDGRTRLGG